MHRKPFLLLEERISRHLLKKVADYLGGPPLRRQVAKMLESLLSMLITSTVYKEGNAGRIIVISFIERTFNNDYVHILHDLSKRYI